MTEATERVRIRLAYQPRPWQAEVHRRRKRFSVLAVHRRAGKTMAAVMTMLDAAASSTLPQAQYFYVAPQLKQARSVCWSMLKALVEPLRSLGAVEVREGDLLVRFAHNGAVVRLYGADNPDAMRGVRLDGVVLDEVAQMSPSVWHEVVQPALSDRLGWALFIGTPNGINLFSELFHRAAERQAEGSRDWYAGRYTVDDTDALDEAEVDRLRDEMNETAYAREMLCDFTASGDDQLLGLADVDAAAKRHVREHDIARAPVVLGVDPARFGDDRSVIVRRQGLLMFDPIILREVDNMALAERVAAEVARHRPDAVFVDSGAGAGVIDRLRQLRHDVLEVPFGGKALDSRAYANRRTEMWCEMAKWLRDGGVIPDSAALKQELATPTYAYDAQGRRVLESKDNIRKRLAGAGSPDIADALALTFAAYVAPRHELPTPSRAREYDPFDLHRTGY